MVELVYLKEVNPDTFLHYSVVKSKGKTCLRDYSRGPNNPPEENRDYRADTIEQLLCREHNVVQSAPRGHRTDDTRFWYKTIVQLNGTRGLTGTRRPPRFARLLDHIHDRVAGWLNTNDAQGLKRYVEEDLLVKLNEIVAKGDRVNHYDDDKAASPNKFTKGIHWTSYWLEESRSNGIRYIDSGRRALDFGLLAQEVNLEISRRRNPFHADKAASLNLDGLGIRRDGSFCILEVKGPRDPIKNTVRTLIQAFAGALAVCAKRDWICRLAGTQRKRRPAAHARLPVDRRTIGLYVMVYNLELPCDDELDAICGILYKAFAALKDIAFFDIGCAGNPPRPRFTLKKVYPKGALGDSATDVVSAP